MTRVDKRATPRVEMNAAATIQVLGESSSTNSPVYPVKVVDASERGMRLQSGLQIEAGRAVRIEMNDMMFLGEVCYCASASPDAEKPFNIGIVMEQCLSGLGGLRHLIAALEPENARTAERV